MNLLVGRGHTVLVVEDDVDAREILAITLQARGYQTLEAGNGQEALALLHKNMVSLVLTDLRMPEMSGDELVTAMRKIPLFNKIPVILLTATPLYKEYVELSIFSVLLRKPCSMDDLLATVEILMSAD